MDRHRRSSNTLIGALALPLVAFALSGCNNGPSYDQLRREGQISMINGQYGPARYMLKQAEGKSQRRRVENLHDLGVAHVMVAKEKFAQMNPAAAFRELDAAVDYYSRGIEAHPGHQACLEGKNIALELKGQFEEALKHAEWAAEFVGPSARQQIFLASELEERGDFDAALLRYQQAVAMEPKNANAHLAFAEFLKRHNQDGAAEIQFQEAQRLQSHGRRLAQKPAMQNPEPTFASP
jgi:tetratricopeptide (TPR) repeat protein